jgi:hypothetical protein
MAQADDDLLPDYDSLLSDDTFDEDDLYDEDDDVSKTVRQVRV